MILQTVLADDEPLARQKLRQMLGDIPGVDVIGEGASAAEVLDMVRDTAPQLLFRSFAIAQHGLRFFLIAPKIRVGSAGFWGPAIEDNVRKDEHEYIALSAHAPIARAGAR